MRTMILAAVLGSAALAGCSTRQGYAVAQQWQLSECRKLQDRDEQARCARSNASSFDAYQAERAAARPKP